MTLSDRLFPTLCALGIAILVWYGSLLITHDLWDSDFRVFYTSAILLRTAPGDLYESTAQAHLQRSFFYSNTAKDELILSFVNPPTALVSYLPVSFFPPKIAYAVYSGHSVIVQCVAIYLLIRVFGRSWSQRQKILFALFSLSFAPTFINLISGQYSSFTLLLFACMLIALSVGTWSTAGVLLGLLTYKPQLLLISIYLSKFSQKLGKGIFLGFALSFGLIVLLLNRNVSEFFATLGHYISSTSLEHGKVAQISWQGFVHQLRLFVSLPPGWLTLVLSGTTILIGSLLTQSKRLSPVQTLATCIPLLLLSAIHVHAHDALLLLIPTAYLWDTRSLSIRFLLSWVWFCFFFTYFSPFFPYPFLFFPHITLMLIALSCLKKET